MIGVQIRELARSALAAVSPRLLHELIRWRSLRAQERQESEEWRQRTAIVVACPDNALIPRHPKSGSVSGGLITMFNGSKVLVDGYYGRYMTRLLRANRGSHEPQEELVFAEVLRRLRPGARMIECGAYWGFYSIWFLQRVQDAKAWLIEPDDEHLRVGKQNLVANGVSATICQAFVGSKSVAGAPGTISIDDFLDREKIARLDILHADIQGAEVEMLDGSEKALREKAIDFIFISTHGGDLHERCEKCLKGHQYEVPVSVPPGNSFSMDGLIVACRPGALSAPLPVPSMRVDRAADCQP